MWRSEWAALWLAPQGKKDRSRGWGGWDEKAQVIWTCAHTREALAEL